jgi:hypothetical protein
MTLKNREGALYFGAFCRFEQARDAGFAIRARRDQARDACYAIRLRDAGFANRAKRAATHRTSRKTDRLEGNVLRLCVQARALICAEDGFEQFSADEKDREEEFGVYLTERKVGKN